MKYYKVMAVPILQYGSETVVLSEKVCHLQSCRNEFTEVCKRMLCTRNYIIWNEVIRRKLGIISVTARIEEYRL